MSKTVNTTKDMVIKIVMISIIAIAIGGVIIYNIVSKKFDKEVISLKNEVKTLKEEKNNQLPNIEENKIDTEKEEGKKIEVDTKEIENKSNKTNEEKGDPIDVLNGVLSTMEKATSDLERVNKKITNTGTFSGLQGTFDTLYNYGSQLINDSNNLDLSKVGGEGTAEMIRNLGYKLQGISDANDMAKEASDTMGLLGEFSGYIYNNFSK